MTAVVDALEGAEQVVPAAELFTGLSAAEREQFTTVVTKLMHAIGDGPDCTAEQPGPGQDLGTTSQRKFRRRVLGSSR